jgi:hypothetical protein
MSRYFDTVAAVKSIENEGTVHERVRYDHEAFGEVSVTRRTSAETTMFGSDLGHRSALVIKLSRAHQLRSLNANVVHSDETIVEFEVSESQWAKFVSSPGGGGTPVTLRMAPSRGAKIDGMPMIEAMSMRQQFDGEIEKKFADYMRAGKELLEKFEQLANTPGAISKKDFKEFQSEMSALVDGLPRNFGFMQDQFHRTMERTADQLKTEVEAYLGGKVRQAGLNALTDEAPSTALPNLFDTKGE